MRVTFVSSGLAIIKKKNDSQLVSYRDLNGREFTVKNFLRKLWRKVKKN